MIESHIRVLCDVAHCYQALQHLWVVAVSAQLFQHALLDHVFQHVAVGQCHNHSVAVASDRRKGDRNARWRRNPFYDTNQCALDGQHRVPFL